MAVSLAVLVLLIGTLVGCGAKTKETTGTQTTDTTTTDNTQGSKDQGKTYGIGEKATDPYGETTVTGVKVTDNLASPEANALLLTGAPGEGTNASKAPASGKEFLMITFLGKNTSSNSKAAVKASAISLENAKGDGYELVITNGCGGLFKAPPLQQGEQASVTAVYEVPQGETGLVLTLDEYGSSPIKFKIR